MFMNFDFIITCTVFSLFNFHVAVIKYTCTSIKIVSFSACSESGRNKNGRRYVGPEKNNAHAPITVRKKIVIRFPDIQESQLFSFIFLRILVASIILTMRHMPQIHARHDNERDLRGYFFVQLQSSTFMGPTPRVKVPIRGGAGVLKGHKVVS